MLFTGVLCYSIILITLTESSAYPKEQHHTHIAKKQDPAINRRESTLLVEAYPVEKVFQRSKIIRRISKKRLPIRTTYGPPRTTYTSARTVKKPGKNKHKRKLPLKYSNKIRGHRWYGLPSRHSAKPVYGPPKQPKKAPHNQHNNYYGAGLGFAEPPTTRDHHTGPTKPNHHDEYSHNYDNGHNIKPTSPALYKAKPEHHFAMNEFPYSHSNSGQPHSEYESPKQSYGEPPLDSYGAPIKQNLHDLTYNPTSVYSDADPGYYNNHQWQNFDDLYLDNSNVQAVKKPLDHDMYPPTEDEDEQDLTSYSDIYSSRLKQKKKKKAGYVESVKLLNPPWKGKMREESDEEMIVGGQYAEPPARYVPKFQPSAAMSDDEHEFSPLHYTSPDDIPSATMSSYVNYKNSNMAFSPQNLNDVFSIVDRK